MPERIQRKRAAGWRMPENTVCVSRPSKWGNPFVGPDAAVTFQRWLQGSTTTAEKYLAGIGELRGKNLACWCPVGASCHADTLLELANK